MGPKIQEVGGGATTGLANDFVRLLQQGINTGSFGGTSAAQQAGAANPAGSTQGIFGVLNDILSGGGGNIGGAFQQLIQQDVDRQAGELRSRFTTGGGTAFGTPAAFGEALLRAESAPRITSAVGDLQLRALGQILPGIFGMAQQGTAPRETIATPSTFSQILQAGAPIAAALIRPNSLNIGGGSGGGNTPTMGGGSYFNPKPFQDWFKSSTPTLR